MLKKILIFAFASLFLAAGVFAQGTSTAAAPAAGSKTDAKKPAVFRPTKDQIKQVQTILRSKKLYDGEATGVYTDATRTGIKNFQKDNGLKETGTLNRATLEKFGVELTDAQKQIPVSDGSFASKTDKTDKSSTTKASTDKPKKSAPFRATPEQVKAAQKMLKDGKMYSGEQTGKLDDATRDGLKKYQEANGVKVTGTLNAATLEKMGIALTDQQKTDAAKK